MRIKTNRKWYDVFVLDFESHNDEESIDRLETSIWLGCITNLDKTYFYYSITELFTILKELSRTNKRKNNLLIYVHNLAFEWSFIFPYLVEWGFQFNPNVDESPLSFYSINNSSCSSVWNVKINIGTTYGTIEFRDSAKLFNTTVRKLAKNYGLPVAKGEIDYRLNRLHNHIVTDDEREYCYRDCEIVMLVLKRFEKDTNFWKSLSASSYACNDLITSTYKNKYQFFNDEYDDTKRYTKIITPYAQFRKEYPRLSKEESEYTRNALGGGITWVNPVYQYQLLENVYHIDIHSAHPHQAYTLPLPFGEGKFGVGKPPLNINEIAICRVKISYDEIIIPCIIKLLNDPFIENHEITLFSTEIELCKRCYKNFKVEYLDYYVYKVKKPKFWKWYGVKYDLKNEGKQNGNKYQESHNKLMLNSGGYGKFVEKGHNEIRIPILNDEFLTTETHLKPKFSNGGKYTHIPFGACIPMYTRNQLVSQALKMQKKGAKIIYFDTDSIFFLCDDIEEMKKSIKIGDKIGEWSFEETAKRGVFEVPKRYVLDLGLDKDGKEIVDRKAGGFNSFDIKTGEIDEQGYEVKRPMSFEEILNNGTIEVLMRVKARGGTLLVDKDKILAKPNQFNDITWEYLDAKNKGQDSLSTRESDGF